MLDNTVVGVKNVPTQPPPSRRSTTAILDRLFEKVHSETDQATNSSSTNSYILLSTAIQSIRHVWCNALPSVNVTTAAGMLVVIDQMARQAQSLGQRPLITGPVHRSLYEYYYQVVTNSDGLETSLATFVRTATQLIGDHRVEFEAFYPRVNMLGPSLHDEVILAIRRT
jgi:hypothetical protein